MLLDKARGKGDGDDDTNGNRSSCTDNYGGKRTTITPERMRTPSNCRSATVSLTPSQPTSQQEVGFVPATLRQRRIRNQVKEAHRHSKIGGQERIRDGEYFARLPASGMRPSIKAMWSRARRAYHAPAVTNRQCQSWPLWKTSPLNTMRSYASRELTRPPKKQQVGARRCDRQCTMR